MRTLKILIAGLSIFASFSYVTAQTYSSGYCPVLSVPLQYGSLDETTGGQVSMLQRFLADRGYMSQEYVTGRFFAITAQALKKFQMDNGVSALGIAGPATRSAITRVCGGSIPTTVGGGTSTNNGTPSVSLNVSATSLQSGNYVLVSWDSRNIGSCTLRSGRSGSSEAVAYTGYSYYYPTLTTTYRIECTSVQGVVSAEKTVIVNQTQTQTQASNLLPTVTMNVSNETVPLGSYTLVSWDSKNATTCTGNNLGSGIGTSGYKYFYPLYTTTYRVDCSNASGYSVSAEKMVIVTSTGITGAGSGTGFPNPQVLSFTATPTSVASGQAGVLSWTSFNAARCSLRYAGEYLDYLPASGTRTVNPLFTTSYSLACQNNAGATSAESTLTIAVASTAVNPTVTLTQTKSTTIPSESYTVNWTSANAVGCTLDTSVNGGTWSPQTVELAGSRSFAPATAGTYAYRITCISHSATTPAASTVTHTVSASTTTQTTRNFVNGNGQAACNADIMSFYGSQVATCSIGGGCDGLNPGLWGACVNPTSTTPVTPTVSFTASPATIQVPSGTTLSWSALQANSCIFYANGSQVDILPVVGSRTMNPSATTVYRLVCGTVERSVTVNVIPAAPQIPVVYMTLNPTSVSAASNFTAAWSGTNSPTSYNVRINGIVLPQGTNTTWTGTPMSLSLGAGTHTFYVQGCNAAGCSDWNGPYLLVVSAPTTRNFVDGNGQASCNAGIMSFYGSQVATCSLGGGCDGLNPGLWGACITR